MALIFTAEQELDAHVERHTPRRNPYCDRRRYDDRGIAHWDKPVLYPGEPLYFMPGTDTWDYIAKCGRSLYER